jgi:DNA topoisomerase-1
VQLGEIDQAPDGKPKRSSLFADMDPYTVSLDDALRLLSLPRVVGTAPDGEDVVAQNGKFGPYLTKGSDSRSLTAEPELFTVTLDEALRLFAEPKRRGRAAPKPPLAELGPDPASGKPMVVKDGRFGPYVTDGETNASLRVGDEPGSLSPQRGAELLQARRDAVANGEVGKRPAKKSAAKKAPAKKAGTRKAAAKKAPAKRTAKKAASAPAAGDAAPDPDDSVF